MHLPALLPTPLSLAACHPMPVLRTREGRMVRTVERVVPAVRRASEVKVVIQANGLILTRFRKRFKRLIQNPLIVRVLFRSGEIFIRSVVSFVKVIVEMVRSAVGVSMSSTGIISDRVYGVDMQNMFEKIVCIASRNTRIGQMLSFARCLNSRIEPEKMLLMCSTIAVQLSTISWLEMFRSCLVLPPVLRALRRPLSQLLKVPRLALA